MIVYPADIFAINPLSLLAIFGMAAGLFLFFRGFRLLARKRLLVNTPTSKIRSAAMGLVEVNGLAIGPYTLPAPITGAPCYLYRTMAWRRREDSKNPDWKKVAEETLHVPFFLDDGTGKLLVDPTGADFDLHRDFCQKYDQTWISRVPERGTAFLARHGVTPDGDHIRLEEWTIQPQSPLFIVGTLGENPGIKLNSFPRSNPDASRRGSLENRSAHLPPGETGRADPAPEIVRLSDAAAPSTTTTEMSQQGKIAAALTKAGIQKPEAWSAAGVPSTAIAVHRAPQLTKVSVAGGIPGASIVGATISGSTQENSDFDLSPPVLLMQGGNNPAFLISWRSQREFVRSLAWKSTAMVWGGGGLVLLGLYVLLAQLGRL